MVRAQRGDMDIIIDIEADADTFLRQKIDDLGGVAPSGGSLGDLAVTAAHLDHKCIEPARRRSHLTPTLERRLARCSSRAERMAREVVLCSERGVSLNPSRSKTSAQPTKYDKMLTDWRIHHLHLGESPKGVAPFGWTQRSGALLFAMFFAEDACFLDVRDHRDEDGNAPFADADLFDMAVLAWPEMMEQFRLQGVARAGRRTRSEIEQARKAGFVVAYEAPNGKVYLPGSRMMMGIPFEVRMRADQQLDGVRARAVWADANRSATVDALSRGGFVCEGDRLTWDPVNDALVNRRTGGAVRIPMAAPRR